jgi:hypothetical protein
MKKLLAAAAIVVSGIIIGKLVMEKKKDMECLEK